MPKSELVTITLKRKTVEEMLNWVPPGARMNEEQKELYDAMKKALDA